MSNPRMTEILPIAHPITKSKEGVTFLQLADPAGRLVDLLAQMSLGLQHQQQLAPNIDKQIEITKTRLWEASVS